MVLDKRNAVEIEGEVLDLNAFIESVGKADDHHDDLLELSEDEMRSVIGQTLSELVTDALKEQITAVTGRLID